MKVEPIDKKRTKEWLLNKHYAKREPSVTYSFGLIIDGKLEGVVTYGSPPSPSLCVGICGKERASSVIELNRLCINESAPPNSASFLVGRSIKMLPRDKIIVSYADTSMGHVGKIYQATNFLYTGLSAKRTEWREIGKNTHSKSVCEMYDIETRKKLTDRFSEVQRPQKHRYIMFRDYKDKKLLKYPILPYPKGESRRYETIDIHENTLF